MKYKMDELTPGERYGVMFWQGCWHLIRVDAVKAGAGTLILNWLAVDMPSFEAAQRAMERDAQRADLIAARESAGLCACGLPYEAHDANAHNQPAWTGEEEEYPEDSGSPMME